MLKIGFLIFSILFSYSAFTQSYKATTLEDYTIRLERVDLPGSINFRNSDINQMDGFPKVKVANPSFKDFRNVTLADLDSNGLQDILFSTNNALFAYTADNLLWVKGLTGVGIYPPAVADMDGNGDLEIVQVTGGATGRVYVLDQNGQDRSGWPLNFSNHWILASPTLSDVDGNGEMEIVVNERASPGGKVHILQLDGSSFNENWPVTLDAVPAVTPSVGDVDNDGKTDIVIFSTEARYVFGLDGQAKMGFPQQTHPQQRYSFQSPILADLNGNNSLEIIGATHSFEALRNPYYFVIEADGSFLEGWPISTALTAGTFSTPTVVKINGTTHIFMSLPIGDVEGEVLYGWDVNGNIMDGFPIIKTGGLEGIISVADVDNDDQFELVFGSNIITDGFGYIHAYEMDGTGEVAGFPLRPRGITHMNGASLGDINGDNMMDLVAISYTSNFGQATDSSYLNVYELNVPYTPEKVLWSTYKGSNSRDGLVLDKVSSSTQNTPEYAKTAILVPNPSTNTTYLHLDLSSAHSLSIQLYSTMGQNIGNLFRGTVPVGKHQIPLSLNHFPAGVYWINVKDTQGGQFTKKLIIQPN